MLSVVIKSINRQQWICEAAYYKAMARGFEPHKELDDWLEAERDFLTMLINLQLNVLEEDGTVSTMGLRQIAESLGILHPERMRSEFELIRAIQDASHHRRCFQSKDSASCDEADCQWKTKCRKLVAIWHR
ncbi:MAG: DUF2934 domain-containing protein [Methylococcaceae bacterium]|nr:DUF2934 domain-containing protein [Methylococcaceae bacterium]MDD1608511.1 DUF2934 domain-containing protein [Methylococcaceae bacterium]MDD1609945.1 DUF2934 domain-containing protein [Methylococcaceae bacterium]MDD1616165.1 DUF2934 domain-containing protein [Methylococcaceae bacterium]OYV18416.1 MAG: hypothetical protein CG439_1289 [Methylococcaceae bacterium NSP1-2]